jgi:hypothetical protein
VIRLAENFLKTTQVEPSLFLILANFAQSTLMVQSIHASLMQLEGVANISMKWGEENAPFPF